MNKKKFKNIDLKLDETNRFIIDMNILDNSAFLSPYCGNLLLISSEVASYLENAIKYIPPKFDITLHIKSKDINDEKKNQYKNAIKNYFTNNILQLKREIFFQTIMSLIMLFIGIFIISLMLILSNNKVNIIQDTILEIAGWVFIWEAVDKFFFERHKLKYELRKAYQLCKAEIVFFD